MTTLALNINIKERACGGSHSGHGGKLTNRQPGTIVHGVNPIAGKILKQTVGDHRLGTAQTFFRRLEDKIHLSLKIPRGGQILCRREQHDGMTVVSTGMHGAMMRGTVVKGVLL